MDGYPRQDYGYPQQDYGYPQQDDPQQQQQQQQEQPQQQQQQQQQQQPPKQQQKKHACTCCGKAIAITALVFAILDLICVILICAWMKISLHWYIWFFQWIGIGCTIAALVISYACSRCIPAILTLGIIGLVTNIIFFCLYICLPLAIFKVIQFDIGGLTPAIDKRRNRDRNRDRNHDGRPGTHYINGRPEDHHYNGRPDDDDGDDDNDDNFGYNRGTDGNYYKLHWDKLNWDAAKDVCVQEGASLAMEKTDATHSYIMKSKEIHYSFMWIGVTDKAREGEFLFVDGTPVQRTYWSKGEPDNTPAVVSQNCVAAWRGEWFDAVCNMKRAFLCQKPTIDDEADIDSLGYMKGTDGNSYKLYKNRIDWDAAKGICVQEGASLAMEKTDATHSYITKLMNSQSPSIWMWIGVTDKEKEGEFLFVDGTPVQKTYWAKPYRGDPPEVKGEPNNGLVRDTENCVGIKDEGWIERNCNREYAFLCQKPTL